jgi:hypothetical protein
MAPVIPPPPPRVSVPKAAMPTPPKALKEMKAPKWDKRMERLDATDEELIAATAGRPSWMLPAGVAVIALVLIAFIYGITHRTPPAGTAVRIGNTTVAPTTNTAAGNVPRGGFLTQPSTGTSGSSASPATSPIVANSGSASVDSAAGAVIPILGAPEPDSAAPPAPKHAAPHPTSAASAGGSSSTNTPGASSGDGASASTHAPRAPASSANPDASSRSSSSSPIANSSTAAPDTTRRPDTVNSSFLSTTAARIDSAARAARVRLDSMAAKLMPRRDTTPHPTVTPAQPDTSARVTPPGSPPVRPDTMTTAR